MSGEERLPEKRCRRVGVSGSLRERRGLKTKVGRECSISRGERLYSGGIHVGGVRGESHSVTARGGQLQERELPRALNL